jgi:hypothetical protein
LILLAGGRTIEAMRTHGLSRAQVYKNFREVIKAINECPALAIQCDNSDEGLSKRAREFATLSKHSLFHYCVGAIDGLAISIRAPSKKKVKNQTRYFSGNKKKFCLNLQGVCDAKGNFIAVSCKHVGSANDCVAFSTSALQDICNSLKRPYHWNGDAAYTLTETLMIPFIGANLAVYEPEKEWFNFYHSQLRIVIEKTFGIFIRRFATSNTNTTSTITSNTTKHNPNIKQPKKTRKQVVHPIT